MKTVVFPQRATIVMVLVLLSLHSLAQRNWDTHGINADSSDFLGTINAEPLRIKTDSIDRIIVGVNDSIRFKGTAIFDSIIIPVGHITVDSIRARVIHVGDSSLVLGTGNPVTPGDNAIYTTNTLTNQTLFLAPHNGVTTFITSGNGVNIDNARIGIGIAAPSNQMQLWRNSNVQVAAQFTNSATGVGSGAGDGFLVGIDGSGNAILNQQENLAMLFYTNGSANERMRIAAGGNVGIGTTNPISVLHLNRNANSNVFTLYSNNNALAANGGFEVGLNSLGVGILRHHVDQAIEIWTVGLPNYLVRRNASFTSNATFGIPASGSVLSTLGDGLRIHDPNGLGGDLDLWTSTSNQTHILWGYNGRIFGRNDRFEIQADYTNGLWFNVSNPATRTYFNTQGSENARIGPSGSWRIGPNTTNADPANTLDVNGTAGIRTVTSNPALTKFLVWDDGNNGLIQYRDLSSLGNVTACSTVVANYVTKWCSTTNQIQNSSIFDNGTLVGISVPGNPPAPAAKLDVRNNVTEIGVNSQTTNNSPIFNLGVMGSSQGAPSINVGTAGQSPNSIIFPGLAPVVNLTAGISTTAIPFNAGVLGRAQNASFNFGGIFEANNVQGCPGVNIGVYASAKKTCHPVPGIAGYFNGDIFYTGSPQNVSDIQLKDSIVEFRNSLNVLKKLALKKYVFKTASYPYMNLPEGANYGFISQQVDTILPELVSEVLTPQVLDTSGSVVEDTIRVKTLNYVGLIPLAVGAIQELKSITDSLGLHKASVCSLPTDSNRLSKWNSTLGQLCNSLLYDDGQHVGIPTTDPEAKFYVESDSLFAGSFSSTNGIGGKFYGGIHGLTSLSEGSEAEQSGLISGARGGTSRNKGVVGSAFYYTTDSVINIGVSGIADSSDYVNTGVFGLVNAATENAVNVGVTGIGNGSQNQNMGGYFQTDGINSSDIALFATNLGGNMAGYFDGDVHVTGSITSSSDAALKQNIQSLPTSDAVAKLALLQPKSYEFVDSGTVDINLPRGIQYGFLAQEVEQVLPGLVKEVVQPQRLDSQGHIVSEALEYKGINYTGLIPLLVSAVQEQQNKIDSLQRVIDNRLIALEQRLNNCCERGAVPSDASFKTEGNATVVELNNLQAVVLEQNAPNPFAEQTTINYYIPEGSGAAQVVFFDMLGRTIKSVDAKSGYGSLTVFASNLSQGQYSYALFINGQQIASKSMIKAK